ncbi:MAG TPA: glycosyltransferase family 4 protein [Anaerolineales bacterium]|nr:glycosyltransferase family 4 protein [Anaerolineales bacterium]
MKHERSNPMRVQMIVRLFFPWVGGAERQAYKLSKTLKEKNVHVEIATGWWFRGTPQREVMDGIPVFRNHTLWEMFRIRGLRRFGGYLYMLSLFWYLWRRRKDYDILHVHGLNYHAAVAVFAARLFGRKTIVKLANSGQASDILKMRQGQQLPLSRFLLPLALKSDRFVATSRAIAQELIAVGVPADRITQLPNGVETDEVPAKADYALHNPVRLIFVGRLHEQKGLDILFKAFQQLVRLYPDLNLRLQLLGDGPLRESLTHLAQQLGIASKVDFVGMTDQVFEYLQDADIFVLPSRAEGHSNALLEAMTCGLPSVVSDIPANLHVIADRQNGLTFTAVDPSSLAKAVTSLLEQPHVRERLGKAARQTIENKYSLDFIAERYISLYQEVLADDQVKQTQLDFHPSEEERT